MSNGATTTYQERNQSRGGLLVGIALLGAPVAWAGHLNVNYFLVQPVCRLGGNAAFHVSGVVFLLLAMSAGVVAWRILRKSRTNAADAAESKDLSGFIGLFGIASAGIFSLAIISQWVPIFIVGPCVGNL